MRHLLDHPIISQRYFFPREEEPAEPFPVQSGELTLLAHYHRPLPEAPTVIFFHGNGEVVADYPPEFYNAFSQMGVNLLMASYRGYGGSEGEPGLVGMLDDVAAYIEAAGVPRSRIILFGRSLGSYYAVHGAGLFPDLAGLVLESGIADPLERLRLRVDPEELGVSEGDFVAAVNQALNQRAKLQAFPGPVLVMHTRHDGLVDMTHAERNYQWAAGPKALKIFEQGTHNSILSQNFQDYFQTLAQFFEQVFA